MNAPTHAAYSQTLGIQARAASALMARASAATRSACLRILEPAPNVCGPATEAVD